MYEQVRCASDVEQMELVSSFRQIPLLENMLDVTSTLQELAKMNPINISLLKKLESMQLTISDFINPANHYERHAPIIVVQNCERDNLAFSRAQRTAISLNQPLFTWWLKTNHSATSQVPMMEFDNDDPAAKLYYTKTNGLLKVFVHGAKGYITQNINPAAGMANGTEVIFESLSFSRETQNDPDFIERWNKAKHAGPGEEICLGNFTPNFINVWMTVPDDKYAKWPIDHCLDKTYDEALKLHKVLIPVGLLKRNGSNPAKELMKTDVIVTIDGNEVIVPYMTIERDHQVEFGGLLTSHTAQGKTFPAIALDLNDRVAASIEPHINFHSLLVILSRVTDGKNMKLLPLKNKLESLKYLLKMQLPYELFVWIAGYGAEPGSVWNEEKSRAMFNKIKAAKFPDHKLTKNIL